MARKGKSSLDRWAWGVALLAVALRLVLAAVGPWAHPGAEREIVPDSPRYLELADNLRHHRSFGLDHEDAGHVHIGLYQTREHLGQAPARDRAGLLPESFRTPGFPLLLAALLSLGLPGSAVLGLHALLAGALCMLTYRLGKTRLHAPRAGLLAAGLLAVHPGLIATDLLVLSEPLFVFLLWVSVWLSWPAGNEKAGGEGPVNPSSRAVFAGLAWAATALVKPVAAPLIPLIAAWRLLTAPRGTRWNELKRTALLLLVAALPLGAWCARNDAAGVGARLSTVPEVNAWYYTAAYMDLAEQGRDPGEDWPAAVTAQHGALRYQTRPHENVFDACRRLALQRVGQDPALYLRVLARSMGKLALDHSAPSLAVSVGLPYEPVGLRDALLSGDVGKALAPAAVIPLAWTALNAVLIGLALGGGFRLLRRRQFGAFLLLMGLAGALALATQTNGLERFRLPMLPVLALMAGMCVAGGCCGKPSPVSDNGRV